MSSVCLVQFFHPGVEYDRSPSRADWTTDRQPHRRKFMEGNGRAIGANGMIDGRLSLWGEWEPQADHVMTFPASGIGFPRRLWRPYWSLGAAPPNRLNTDPMIFGGFRYTVCQQHRLYRGAWRQTHLQRLAPGSVILFGSNLRGDFMLDTVFVVRDSRRHDPTTYRELDIPRDYFEVTIATLYKGIGEDGCCKTPEPGDQYTLYDGATVDAPADGLYSFVPCQPLNGSTPRGFRRPTVRHMGLSQTQTQHYGIPIEGDREAIRAVWLDTRDQVLNQGLHLATWLDFPPERG